MNPSNCSMQYLYCSPKLVAYVASIAPASQPSTLSLNTPSPLHLTIRSNISFLNFCFLAELNNILQLLRILLPGMLCKKMLWIVWCSFEWMSVHRLTPMSAGTQTGKASIYWPAVLDFQFPVLVVALALVDSHCRCSTVFNISPESILIFWNLIAIAKLQQNDC